jgi:hypothetical protein
MKTLKIPTKQATKPFGNICEIVEGFCFIGVVTATRIHSPNNRRDVKT